MLWLCVVRRCRVVYASRLCIHGMHPAVRYGSVEPVCARHVDTPPQTGCTNRLYRQMDIVSVHAHILCPDSSCMCVCLHTQEESGRRLQPNPCRIDRCVTMCSTSCALYWKILRVNWVATPCNLNWSIADMDRNPTGQKLLNKACDEDKSCAIAGEKIVSSVDAVVCTMLEEFAG